jgi:hypothetical protein
MMMRDIDDIICRLELELDCIKKNNPYPIGASQSRTKQDAYYRGIRAGLITAIRLLKK